MRLAPFSKPRCAATCFPVLLLLLGLLSVFGPPARAATPTVTAPSLAAPTNLSSTPSVGRITLRWRDNAQGEIGYKVVRSTDNVSFAEIFKSTTPNQTSFVDSSVVPGNRYFYHVRAYAAGASSNVYQKGTGNSAYSNLAQAIAALPAPSNLKATPSVSPQKITLTWSDNATNETGYKIERQAAGGAIVEIARGLAPNQKSYTDTNVTPGVIYKYRVRAYIEARVNSAYSNVAQASIASSGSPNAPSGLSAVRNPNAPDTSINLSWVDNSNNETGFRIIAPGGNPNVGTVVGPNVTSYTSTGLNFNTEYCFAVVAFNSAGNSPESEPMCVRTAYELVAPINLVAETLYTDTVVQLSWQLPSQSSGLGIRYFELERAPGGATPSGAFAKIADVPFVYSGPITYNDDDVTPGATYSYRVRTVFYEDPRLLIGTLYSAYSNVAQATVPSGAPSAPQDFEAYPAYFAPSSTIQLVWSAPASGPVPLYRVYVDGVEAASYASDGADAISGLQPDTTYHIYMTAVNDAGESPPTPTITVTTYSPEVPEDPFLTAPSSGGIDVAWRFRMNNLCNVERSRDGVHFSTVASNVASTFGTSTGFYFSHHDNVAQSGTFYYRIRSGSVVSGATRIDFGSTTRQAPPSGPGLS